MMAPQIRLALALALAFVVYAAGCLTQDKIAECGDVGCPVGAIEAAKDSAVCDNGLLEEGEDCESGIACKSGFCRHCTCVDSSSAELAADCPATCSKYGYRNASVVADGTCAVLTGQAEACVAKCSYRKIFPTPTQGSVCCCRQLSNIRCESYLNGTCGCPNMAQMKDLCTRYDPQPKNSTSNETAASAEPL